MLNYKRVVYCCETRKPGQDSRRHPEKPPYRCFLSDLTGFAGLRRAGPTRTSLSILHTPGTVNKSRVRLSYHSPDNWKKNRLRSILLINELKFNRLQERCTHNEINCQPTTISSLCQHGFESSLSAQHAACAFKYPGEDG